MKKVMMMNICICVYGCPPYYKASFSLKKPQLVPVKTAAVVSAPGARLRPQEDRITVINTEAQDKPSLLTAILSAAPSSLMCLI